MAKVLISFVGTGKFQAKEMESTRDYQTTCYHIDDNEIGQYPFVAAGLAKHQQVDKTILIGTVHSMWEEVYRYFSDFHGQKIDEDKYLQIAEYCEKATSKSPLTIPHQDIIEQTVGDAHILLVRYGLNKQEIDENSNIILNITNLLSTGDEVIVDITHSFRSLPIMIMNLLIYIKNVSRKSIKITHIYYGMLEMFKENEITVNKGFAPIIDLKDILNLNDWIIGAYSFSQYGNAYKIAELLQGIDNETASRLKSFSDKMNLNHLDAIEDETNSLKPLKNKFYDSLLPEMIIKPVVNDFLKEFGTTDGNHALFQYRLALWHFKHMNYALSLIVLKEAIITYVCVQEKMDWRNRTDRQEVVGLTKEDKHTRLINKYKQLKACYTQINNLRNCVAHTIETEENASSMITTLRNALNNVKELIAVKEKIFN